MTVPTGSIVGSILYTGLSLIWVVLFMGWLDDGWPFKRKRKRVGMSARPVRSYIRCLKCHGNGCEEGWMDIPCGRCGGKGHLGPAVRKPRNPFSWFLKEKKPDEGS